MTDIDHVLISGSYGTKNLGDTKILEGLTHLCQENYPDAEVIAASVDPSDTMAYTSIDRAIPTIESDPIRWLQTIREVDLVILGGGSVINHTHFCPRHSLISAIAFTFNIDIYVSGGAYDTQGIVRKATRHYLNIVDAITVRDPRSKEIIRSMGVKEPVEVVPDPGFVSTGTDSIDEFDIPKEYILVNIRYVAKGSVDRSAIASALDDFNSSSNHKIIFFPFHRGEGKDTKISEEIIQEMKTRASIFDEEYTIGQVESIIKNADAMVGMRLHSMILAAHMRTPLIPISYNIKCDSFLEQIGVQDWFKWSDINERKLSAKIVENTKNESSMASIEEKIESLEKNCTEILPTCDSQCRNSSLLSYIVLIPYSVLLTVIYAKSRLVQSIRTQP